MMANPRECQFCFCAYQGGGVKFCSPECAQAARIEYVRAYNRTYQRGERAPQNRTPIHPARPCQRKDCGAIFTPTHGRQIYCCHTCTLKANRSAHGDKGVLLRRAMKKHGLMK